MNAPITASSGVNQDLKILGQSTKAVGGSNLVGVNKDLLIEIDSDSCS
jgi:hypothetical protein